MPYICTCTGLRRYLSANKIFTGSVSRLSPKDVDERGSTAQLGVSARLGAKEYGEHSLSLSLSLSLYLSIYLYLYLSREKLLKGAGRQWRG